MNRVFLNGNGEGVTRAKCTSDGQWLVTRHAREHKITCLAAASAIPGRVYAGTRAGVLRSDDGGLTWQPCSMARRIVKSLAISPHDPGVLYAGTKPAAVFKSEDGGKHWRELEGFQMLYSSRAIFILIGVTRKSKESAEKAAGQPSPN